MIKIGVIGVGSMGSNHLRVYNRLSAICRITGIYDSQIDRAKDIAAKYRAEVYDDMDELIENADALSIVVPSQFHFEVARRALSRGKHIMVEKPLTTTIEDAQALIRLASVNNAILQVGHIERFNPAVRELKKILEGEEVLAIEFSRMSPYDPRVAETDVIQDLMIHDIDILKYLFPYDEYGRMNALGAAPFTGQLADYVVATFELSSGIVVSMAASRITEEKIRKIEVHTRSSFISVDLVERKIVIARRTTASFVAELASTYRHESVVERVYVPNYEPLQEELESFVTTVRDGGIPLVTGEDGLFAIDVVEKIRKAVYS